MNKRHKHADVIIAWANGEEIEIKKPDGWEKAEPYCFLENNEYRIKPKIVKREGWVNTYPNGTHYGYNSKEIADANAGSARIACIRIEWEEEV